MFSQNFHESSSARITQDKNVIILIKSFPINLFLFCEFVCKSMSPCRKLDCLTRCRFCNDIEKRNRLKKKRKEQKKNTKKHTHTNKKNIIE